MEIDESGQQNLAGGVDHVTGPLECSGPGKVCADIGDLAVGDQYVDAVPFAVEPHAPK
jgi:hypothetical protein